ncbi:MAG TPA: hypothetical protein PKD05_06445, partial [Candidatus Melainabacteria bacterium]|nr:hypothetical protein [Candidatus Melainabacteria bacterium]
MTRPLEAEPAVFGPNVDSSEPDRQKGNEHSTEETFDRFTESPDFSVFHADNNLVALLAGDIDKRSGSQVDVATGGERKPGNAPENVSEKESGSEAAKRIDTSKPLFGADDLIIDIAALTVVEPPVSTEKQADEAQTENAKAKDIDIDTDKATGTDKATDTGIDTDKYTGPTRHETADGSGNAWVRVAESSSSGASWKLQNASGVEITDSLPGLSGAADDSSKKLRIDAVEPQDDRSIKLSLDDGSVLRSRPDGSVLRYSDESAFG